MVEVARAFTVTEEPLRPGHSRRADLLARRPHRRPAARLRAPRRRRRRELHPDLASARRDPRQLPTASWSCATARSSPPTRPRAFDRDKLVGGHGRRRARAAPRPRRQPPSAARRARRSASAPGPSARATAPSSSPMRARSSALPASPATARPSCCSRSSTARSRRAPAIEVDRAGGARRRRPPDRRHLPALVDRREHRHPLARRRCASGLLDLGASARPSWPTAGASKISIRTPDIAQQHPLALRRQPAEGAVRPRARLGRARSC